MALAHAVVDLERRRGVAAHEQGLGRLAGALERAAHDRRERHDGEPRRDGGGLLPTLVVEVDAGRPAGEDTGRVRSCPTVPDEDDGGHAATLRPNPVRC